MADEVKVVEIDQDRKKLVELIEQSLCDHISFSCKLAEHIADDLIANGVTVPKWIPVAERLPDAVGSYLVVVKAKYDYEDQYEIDTDVATYNPYESGYIDNCWNTYNDWDEGQQYIHITHWMPLPEPPKGE